MGGADLWSFTHGILFSRVSLRGWNVRCIKQNRSSLSPDREAQNKGYNLIKPPPKDNSFDFWVLLFGLFTVPGRSSRRLRPWASR